MLNKLFEFLFGKKKPIIVMAKNIGATHFKEVEDGIIMEVNKGRVDEVKLLGYIRK